MTVAWILGRGGLLGSALSRTLRLDGTELFAPIEPLRWRSESDLAQQLTAAVQAFAVRAEGTKRWEIYWAAGVGTMSSSEDELAPETRVLALLLRLVEATPQLGKRPGAITFASSAGAIYAGSQDYIISENTLPAPTTAYAHEKLKQEELIRSFVRASNDRIALLARLSTIYGPGQSWGKQQGLLAHIARCILRNKPIQIYVPLDTIRDYINADDAAASMIAALRAFNQNQGSFLKIIASEQPATIAEIISLFKRITRRTPRIVTSASKLTNVYSHRVQFRSIVVPQCATLPRTSLLTGIAQVMIAERSAYIRDASISLLRGGS